MSVWNRVPRLYLFNLLKIRIPLVSSPDLRTSACHDSVLAKIKLEPNQAKKLWPGCSRDIRFGLEMVPKTVNNQTIRLGLILAENDSQGNTLPARMDAKTLQVICVDAIFIHEMA